MKKGLAPKGMRPAWSPAARAKYVECVSPTIEEYKVAVDKVNRKAEEDFQNHRRDYLVQTFSLGLLSGLFTAASSDVPIAFQARTETPPKRFLGNANRVMFWVTFIMASYVFIDKRVIALRRDVEDFTQSTHTFFDRVKKCRENNPYDMWVQFTPEDLKAKEFLDLIKLNPNNGKLPTQNIFKK